MARVVCTSYLFPDQVDRLKDAGHEVWLHQGNGRIPRERLIAELADAEALICLLTDRIDRELLGAAPSLRVVANVAVGYENVDIDTASELGIVVTNTPDVLTEATADLTFALLLTAARRGRLGFGMRILYHSRSRVEAAERDLDAEFVPFDRLLTESDFVSVHVPLTDETRHLFDRDAFARMKPTAILVNVARGPVVDEDALVRALEEGEIAGAGIDVFEHEPDVHPGLIRLRDRVVLTPHLGSATCETRRAMAQLAVDNVLAVLTGERPLTPVN